ncbi:MAG: acyl-CoA desaturase [Chloroflexi bacterium]|nr:acyl-CoA desaturase [Chloroflexota bacterium]
MKTPPVGVRIKVAEMSMTEAPQNTLETPPPAARNGGSTSAVRAEGASANADAASVSSSIPSARPRNNDYVVLKRMVLEAGLLQKQPRYYAFQMLLIAGLLAASIATLVLVESLWLQLLNAAFLAFIFTQVSFLGHDAAHRQIFRSVHLNNVFGTGFWNVVLGMSNRWFIFRHNRHHAHPNEEENDPDADLIMLSFSKEQARTRLGLIGFMVRYQVLLVPLLALEMIVLRYASYRFFFFKRGKYPPAEVAISALSLAVYLALAYYFLGLGGALLFIAVHQLCFGLYFASVIASNHKGMPIWEPGREPDFLRQQVLTARNVSSHPLADFWYGGLNYQIEHHLFPSMPRNRLCDAQPLVEKFCADRGVAYHETSVTESYREIFQHLKRASAPIRESRHRA